MTASDGVRASMMASELDIHLPESKRLEQPNCKNEKGRRLSVV